MQWERLLWQANSYLSVAPHQTGGSAGWWWTLMRPPLLVKQKYFLWLQAAQAEQSLGSLQNLYMEPTLLNVLVGLYKVSCHQLPWDLLCKLIRSQCYLQE